MKGAVRHGQVLAMHRLSMTEGHLTSLAKTIRDRHVASCFTLSRAAAELAAQALWLIEPDDQANRAARYLADRWNGLAWLARLRPAEAEALKRMALEEADGLRAEGFEIGMNNGWPRQANGVGKANYLDQVASAFSERQMGEEAYRILSTFSHGMEQAFAELSATVEGQPMLVITASQMTTAIRLAVWPYHTAVRRYGQVTGYDARPVLTVVQELDSAIRRLLAAQPSAADG